MVALASVSCSDATGRSPNDGTLELFTWWSNPGEAAALTSLLDRYDERYGGTKVILTNPSTRTAAQNQLETRMASGSPPDTFQTVGGLDLERWIDRGSGGDLEPVDMIAEGADLLRSIPGAIRTVLSYEGQLYAIPLDVPRLNLLYYNAQVFSRNQLSPPTTLGEFYAVADALVAKGIVPLALGTRDGSIVSQLLFDAILIRNDGHAFRDEFLEGKADPEDPRVLAAVSELGKVLTYANDDRNSIDWPQAALMVVEGAAAMTFAGEWAKAFFATAGLDPATELGQVVFPETAGNFAYLTNAFVLPKDAPHRQAALNFLSLIGTQDAANGFSPLKGTTPARLDVNRARSDQLAQQNYADFRSSTLVLGHIAKVKARDFLIELDATMRQFAIDGASMPVVNMLRNRYGQL